MKALTLIGALILALSSCSGTPAPDTSVSPIAGKPLAVSDCEPLAFPSTDNPQADLTEAQKIAAAALDLFVDAAEEDASTCAHSMGLSVRIVSRDGEEFVVTMDYLPSRVNFSVERGIVTAATVG